MILSVDRRKVQNTTDFQSALKDVKEGDTVLLRVLRQGSSFFMAFSL